MSGGVTEVGILSKSGVTLIKRSLFRWFFRFWLIILYRNGFFFYSCLYIDKQRLLTMIIKNVGKILLIKLHGLTLLIKIAPLLLIISLVLPFWVQKNQQHYEFQEPSLKTKLFDLVSEKKYNPTNQIFWKEQGIEILKFTGLLSHECVLVTARQELKNQHIFQELISTLQTDYPLPKNIVILYYSSTQTLDAFLTNYFSTKSNLDLGIIRAALNVEFEQGKKSAKLKAYFNTYSKSGVRVQLDYFMAVKQLLQISYIPWSPCKSIHRFPFNDIRKHAQSLSQSLECPLGVYLDHMICQLVQSFSPQTSANVVLTKRGFQAATLSFSAEKSDKTSYRSICRVVYSFLREFSVQEDHLHSSPVIYYPFTKTHFVPMNVLFLGGTMFLLASIVIMLKNYVVNLRKSSFKLSWRHLLFFYLLGCEHWLFSTVYLSCCFFIITKLVCWNIEPNALTILLTAAFSSLFGFYFSILNLPLSFLCFQFFFQIMYLPKWTSLLLTGSSLTAIILFQGLKPSLEGSYDHQVILGCLPWFYWMFE